MLCVQHLRKSLGGRRIIEDVTLEVGRGEIVGLLGRNGAGKSTSFKMLTGLIIPDAGKISLDGAEITFAPFYERARRGIAYLPQDTFVPRTLSVETNLNIVLEVREPSAKRRRAIAEELLELFHLTDLRRQAVGSLSGGQRRRCEIAITLACEPSFALLDEPFARVDPQAIEEIAALIRQLTSRNIGVLITDHNARELLHMVNRSYVIESGRVLAHGTPEELVDNPDVRRVYLGEEFRI
ncbi:lipopolysaccharide export system ATP-binding protein [Rhizomicrobium palustre]|uniref:Lipopolysaccharide export system ATP-binding protein LptB n=1 Tax=Rhizomicrobium palustre TaxID=189966 RepID=A0A846MWM1_9PROT|nr:LPS export ABC transporter ATP-binding protein [Rhizomicrobium palustre]NIK87387.1 lipopolysaccharide export system ATP-binding protein [Rhizomicrobium palustre]